MCLALTGCGDDNSYSGHLQTHPIKNTERYARRANHYKGIFQMENSAHLTNYNYNDREQHDLADDNYH